MRLPFPLALALALVLAGCTANAPPEDLVQSSTQPTPTTTTSAPTAGTQPTSPSPASQPTSPSSPPPSAPTPPSPPPPPRPADYHANQTGWVNVSPPATQFVAKIAFPVQAGATEAIGTLSVWLEGPAGPLPAQAHNFSLEIRDPEGKLLRNETSEFASQGSNAKISAKVEAANLTKIGQYTLVVTTTGLSDGQSLGQKYLATIDVKY